MTPLQKLVAMLDADGHAAAARGLIEVNHLMREYAFSRDPLTEKAAELGMGLRLLVADWCRRPSAGDLPPAVGAASAGGDAMNRTSSTTLDWIPMKRRRPPHYEKVLSLTHEGEIIFGFRSHHGKRNTFVSTGVTFYLSDIEWWAVVTVPTNAKARKR
jgi:hypothetical protein